jgi:GTPase SAR1 family protein
MINTYIRLMRIKDITREESKIICKKVHWSGYPIDEGIQLEIHVSEDLELLSRDYSMMYDGALIVYDSNEKETEMKEMLEKTHLIKEMGRYIPVVLVGTKRDFYVHYPKKFKKIDALTEVARSLGFRAHILCGAHGGDVNLAFRIMIDTMRSDKHNSRFNEFVS